MDNINNIIESQFFNNCPTSAIVFEDKDLKKIVNVSANIKTLTSYDKNEFLLNNILFQNLIEKSDLEEILKVFSTNTNNNFELPIFTITDKKKKHKHIKANANIENGFYVLFLNDITNEYKAKKANNIDSVLYLLPDLLWMKDKDGTYLNCNKKFEEFFGAKKEQIIGKTDYDFVDKQLGDFFRKHDLEAMNSNIPVSNFEELTFSNDKHKEYCLTIKTKMLDENNELSGILGIARDISEIKKLQDTLEAEKVKYKKLLEQSSDAIFIVDENAKVIEVSKEFCKVLGYTKKEALNLYVWDFEAIHKKEQIKENIKKDLKSPMGFESKYITKDGLLIDVSIKITSIKINHKAYTYSSFRDITKEKELQDKILKQKNEFESIFNYSQDSIVIIDFNFKILNFNDAFIKLTTYEKEEINNLCYIDLIIKEDKTKFLNAIHNASKLGHSEYFEKSILVKENRRIIVSICISSLPNKDNFLLTIKDITSKKTLEKQSKLASMGEMIGNIAHQWRQPLSVITMNASGLKLQSQLNTLEQKDIDTCVDSIMKQAKYLSNTIDNFRNFIKGNKDEIIQVSIKEVIEDTLTLVQASLKNNYIQAILDIDDYKIYGNKNELIEAFINIINNSKDALKQNVKNESDRFIFIKTVKHKNELELLIYDSALGIPDNIIDKIFEPYFTTKHKSNGTGLGLAIVDRVLRQRHNAQINVFNKEFVYNNITYKGCCFSIVFKE
ncbi:PAS domain-containing protein [Arcobacter roscoffensis]|uniref:histidine kinase n=1 Tax=Arcobacter roscoffensis TaxID=2961520 RepID=A0ABY5E764_9BACT|nr:PAS domain S-box protein [Arcobacter roscoffensis]UTJ07590.1 PAS domain S-box protein [Arcobacter roscoffensis]